MLLGTADIRFTLQGHDMTTFTEHPPVPKVLQEALKDYPDLIARLQEVLEGVGLRPGMSKAQRTDQFEAAIWSLEGRLDSFISETASEVRIAEATGDLALVAKAKEKKMLVSGCRHEFGLDELADFFRWGQD